MMYVEVIRKPHNKAFPHFRGNLYAGTYYGSFPAATAQDFDYIFQLSEVLQLIRLAAGFCKLERTLGDLAETVKGVAWGTPLSGTTAAQVQQFLDCTDCQRIQIEQRKLMQQAAMLPRRRCVAHPIYRPFRSFVTLNEEKLGVKFKRPPAEERLAFQDTDIDARGVWSRLHGLSAAENNRMFSRWMNPAE